MCDNARVWEFNLPQYALGMFIGKQGRNIKALQYLPVDIELNNTQLTVVGEPHSVQIIIDNVKAIVRESELQQESFQRRYKPLEHSNHRQAFFKHRHPRTHNLHQTLRKTIDKRKRPQPLKKDVKYTTPKPTKPETTQFDYDSDNALEL
jgi:rRNA processing protein Krr1/Pno1